MKIKKMILLSMVLLAIVFVYGTGETVKSMENADKPDASSETMAGNVDRGTALFNDQSLGNGTTGMSCNSCHPKGRGLEGSAEKTSFHVMGKVRGSLEETVNYCIEKALKGTAISPQSQDMQDIVAYIKSLKK